MSQGRTDDDVAVPIISASEIGRYAYCARAWWLQRVLGYIPHNTAALERGIHHHEAHGRAALAAQRYVIAARWLLLAALSIAITLVLLILRT